MPSKIKLNGTLLFPSKWLACDDLGGKDSTVEIKKVRQEMLHMPDNSEEPGLIVAFKGAKKEFICNVTNGNTIAGHHGQEATEWIGKKVTLYPTTCRGKGGETVDCIRVR